ncbi:glycogen synthase [Candidatus Gottesmanbacteria bacterium]|nr:glycogen synthase [Candidatus Gottesmanbacteria bacterium]
MNILFAASEVAQISQLGGLGDVVAALPKELHTLGVRSRIVVPWTSKIDLKRFRCEKILQFSFTMGGMAENVNVWKSDFFFGVPVYILENRRYFGGEMMYRDFNGYLEPTRYMFFSKAVLELILQWDFVPDVIHSHDFYTATISLFRNTVYKKHPIISKIGILMTIHSIRAQGRAHNSILDFAGIKKNELTSYKNDPMRNINFVEQEILNADIITTVSPTYAKEVLTPQFGYGIEKTLKKRKKDFYGILNGIDINEYNPRLKHTIYHSYGIPDVLEKKLKNKKKLLGELHLRSRDKQPLLSIVTRLDDQKGIDLIFEVFPRIMDLDMTFVLLGQGRVDYINKFKKLAEKYPGKVRLIFKFDHELSKLIYAGSDMFLMPSRFEPCGLTDMIAMRFGTLPIVRLSGGLKDVVSDGYNGFGFVIYNAENLFSVIKRANNSYINFQKLHKVGRARDTQWMHMIERAMRKNFSWKKSARQYKTLYRKIIRKLRNGDRE